MNEEALNLANYVDAREINNPHLKEASAMIRRLVEELKAKNNYLAQHCSMIDEQQKEIKNLEDAVKNALIYINNHKKTKPLSDEEIDIIKYAVGSAICSLESEINEQEKTFKGYEHCSNLSGLREELNDCLKAKDILERHGIK